MVKIGIIGGSGLDNPNILQDTRDVEVETPYGKPSSPLRIGKIQGIDVVLLARHGRDHSIMPSQVNNQANIWALKSMGCTHLLASTACGSLREDIKPGDFVFVDQFIDRTTKRKQTFYEEKKVCHIPLAEPFCGKLRELFTVIAQDLQLSHHARGTVITIEGPRFSTRAESKLFQQWGADVINMSTAPEAVLAREAGLCYAAVAMSTDYDCWRSAQERVTWEEVLKVFHNNVEKIIRLFVNTIPRIQDWQCSCQEDIKTAVMGDSENKEEKEKKQEAVTVDLKKYIRTIPHWPKQGVMFRDITTLIENPDAFRFCVEKFKQRYQNTSITKILGIESRGFIFAAALALELGLPLVLARKKGKLPAATLAQEYALEYGTATLEIHQSSLISGDKVLIIDDLCATGGTALAACQLAERAGAQVAGVAFVINLPELKGTEKLAKYHHFYLVEFEGE